MLVTEHLQVWYRKPTPVGALVYAMARLKQVDGHKAHLVGEARLNAPDGTIAAQAAATVVLLSHERYHALSGPPEAASGS
ncbi:hypothetical protein B0I33_102215 [Prauserella shujinwangii]|uniref:Thioesterase superfamily protein n=2 Tax=Prauserella shujinwangii TaxID=1453103 RepID=A0A2T0M0K7_9PSEU|nr:hypothetical protein B0I33_102215 [Prauserella shujinwangii]